VRLYYYLHSGTSMPCLLCEVQAQAVSHRVLYPMKMFCALLLVERWGSARHRKSENPAWRLSFVVTNPPWHERLEENDKVYVLRERGGPWMA